MRKRYLKLSPEEWQAKIKAAQDLAHPCCLCPRQCQAQRPQQRGFCQQGPMALAHMQDHFGEEPFLVGQHGSAAFFFMGCNLRCVYCQNWEISRGKFAAAQIISPSKLAQHFLRAQEREVANLNLVTPTVFLPEILAAIYEAAQQGLKLPIVYNTSSYESPRALAILENVVDIYLADLKYDDAVIAQRYSAAANYPQVAQHALQIMQQQVGGLIWQGGQLRRGLVIRHLVLPGQVAAAQRIGRWVAKHFAQAYFSLLAQYNPPRDLPETNAWPELKRGLTPAEYALAWAAAPPKHCLGQELSAASTWVPCFNTQGSDKFKHDN